MLVGGEMEGEATHTAYLNSSTEEEGPTVFFHFCLPPACVNFKGQAIHRFTANYCKPISISFY